MTPDTFVTALKKAVNKVAESEVEYYAKLPSPNPPEHLTRFSAWYCHLSPSDREVASEVIRFAAKGSLATVLTYLDNIASLCEGEGGFELWYVGKNGERTRLNDPNGELPNELL